MLDFSKTFNHLIEKKADATISVFLKIGRNILKIKYWMRKYIVINNGVQRVLSGGRCRGIYYRYQEGCYFVVRSYIQPPENMPLVLNKKKNI